MSSDNAGATLLKGGTVLTMDSEDSIVEGDVLVEDGRIVGVRSGMSILNDFEVVDVSGMIVMPGFVQTHVHLCQTLWRSFADDMTLMDWLTERTWPLEAAHDEATIRASTRLGVAELLLSGTTTLNDMGTVRHTDVIVEEAGRLGIRGLFSKMLMDNHDGPEALREDPDTAVTEALALASGSTDPSGLIGIALAPRFAVSSSMRLLELVARASQDKGLMVHTHCSENDDEVELTVDRFGVRPVALFEGLGMMGPNLLLAHCVKIDDRELGVISDSGASVLHCPTANMKLGSGIAPVTGMLDRGIRITLGSDGAACNNNLSMFREMRNAALLQKVRGEPEALPAMRVLRMATIDGAMALGMGDLTGSIEPGKRADITVLDPNNVCSVPMGETAGSVVFSMGPQNVKHVVVDGAFLVRDGRLRCADEGDIVHEAIEASKRLKDRAQL